MVSTFAKPDKDARSAPALCQAAVRVFFGNRAAVRAGDRDPRGRADRVECLAQQLRAL
ncbi:hypothetical protein GCM10010521_75380 [Streptomyces rameus]|uniref:Uncharacterized protein n=1 Tax=Streptomyces rameus TaxID=68261 RepID=A0ABN3VAA8_9ACTN